MCCPVEVLSIGYLPSSSAYAAFCFPSFPLLSSRLVASAEKYVGVARHIARYMDEVHVDVVHAILPSAYLIAVMANIMTKRRPLAMSRVSQSWYQKQFPAFGVIERCCHSRLDVAIGNSQAVLNELRAEGIPDQKLMLIHNGIDLKTFVGEMLDCKMARSDSLFRPMPLCSVVWAIFMSGKATRIF